MGFKDSMRKAVENKRAQQPGALDQLRGLGRVVRQRGLAEGMNPFAVYKAGKQVKAEREIARGDQYYSKLEHGRMDILVDKAGNPTKTYPHVHVVHNDSGGGIRVIASRAKGARVFEVVLPSNADGRQVEAAVREARSHL